MAAITLEQIAEHLNCPVCFESYRGRDPRGLPCLHCFCRECLERFPVDENGAIRCPMCRAPYQLPPVNGVADIPVAFSVNMLIDLYESLEGLNIVRDDIPVCNTHGKVRELYCKHCDEVICSDCLIDNHQGEPHRFQRAVDVYEAKKQEIEVSLTSLCASIAKIEADAVCFDNDTRKVNQQSADARRDIDRFVDELHRRLDLEKERLLHRVEELQRQRGKTIQGKQEAVETLLFQLKSCQDFIQGQLQNGSPVQVVAIKRNMVSYMRAASLNVDMDLLKSDDSSISFHATPGDAIGNVGTILLVETEKCQVIDAKYITSVNKRLSFYIEVPAGTKLPEHGVTRCSPVGAPDSSLVCKMKKIDSKYYKVSMIPKQSGPYRVNVEICGQHLKNSPFIFRALPPYSVPLKTSCTRSIDNLEQPSAVAVRQGDDNCSIIAIVERSANRVSIYDGNGERKSFFGERGANEGQFLSIEGIAFANDGNLLVTDDMNRCLQKFTVDGHFMACVLGGENVRFVSPSSIAVHPVDGRVFVGDRRASYIFAFNPDLTYSHSLSTQGFNPHNMAFDSKGYLYVADYEATRVYISTPEDVRSFQCNFPFHLCFDSHDILYVMQQYRKPLRSHHIHYISVFDCQEVKAIKYCRQLDWSLKCPGSTCRSQMAIDWQGLLYVCDPSNGVVCIC